MNITLGNKYDLQEVVQMVNEFGIPDDFPDAYAYGIRNKKTGNFQIGIVMDTATLLSQLQTESGKGWELIACVKALNRFCEKEQWAN